MRCDGCGQDSHECMIGHVAPINTTATKDNLQAVAYCPECWDIVDNCDPITGSYGAAACEVRRAQLAEVEKVYGQATT